MQPEFLNWLEDPEQNGDGALYDFGCYGADLVTWLMHGESPVSVTAVTQTDNPRSIPGWRMNPRLSCAIPKPRRC